MQAGFDERVLAAKNEAYTQNLIEANYAVIAADVAPSVSGQLNTGVFRQDWESLYPLLDVSGSMDTASFTVGGNAALTEVIYYFENRDLLLNYTYNT